MAGTGPAPKHNRQRRNEPARGEWITLPVEVKKSLLPQLPRRTKKQGKWSQQTLRAYAAWKKDPATTQYGPAEIQAVVDLAYLHELWVRGDQRLASELRLRMDGLGLTAKGKKDLRWKLVDPNAEVAEAEGDANKTPEERRSLMRAVKAV